MDNKEIRISNELLAKLCKDGIDVSQVGDAVEYAEDNNLFVYDSEKDIYHTHKKIGSITLWVSYIKRAECIEVIESYIHRMDIKEDME